MAQPSDWCLACRFRLKALHAGLRVVAEVVCLAWVLVMFMQAGVAAQSPRTGGVVLSASLPANDPITRQLLAGQLEAAKAAALEALRTGEGSSAVRLYQAGVATMATANGAKANETLADAGLLFAQVVFINPESNLAGAATVELGYVHQRLGRPDTAERLYNQAAASLTRDPPMRERLTRLQQELAQQNKTR